MINNSPAEYIFIRICIFFLQAIGPISLLFLCLTLVFASRESSWDTFHQLVPWPIQLWLSIEGVWYLLFACYREHLQRDAVHPELRSKEERKKLFKRVIANTEPEQAERHVRGWFQGAYFKDIGRDGVKRWISWALFEGRDGKDDENEIEEYTVELETLLDKPFPPGPGKATPLVLTLDRIPMSHRSLLWYLIISIVDFLVYIRLNLIGYTFHRLPSAQFFTLFPFRPIALTATHLSPARHLTYWYRPHTSKTHQPILFIHGIGIGLYPYCDFLKDIKNLDESIGIIALELMPISFRLTQPMPSKEDMCREVHRILTHHNFSSFVLASHSYGSVITTHLLHSPLFRPATIHSNNSTSASLRASSTENDISVPQISSILLLDPVTLLLHTPSVAFNFTRRLPKYANEWQLWYFASQDPSVAHTLGRRFFWGENVLWVKEELLSMVDAGMRVTVGLSERDTIVWTEGVGRYLAQAVKEGSGEGVLIDVSDGGIEDVDDWKHNKWRGRGLEILWFDDTDHAQVFDDKEKRARLLEVIKIYCKPSTTAE